MSVCVGGGGRGEGERAPLIDVCVRACLRVHVLRVVCARAARVYASIGTGIGRKTGRKISRKIRRKIR